MPAYQDIDQPDQFGVQFARTRTYPDGSTVSLRDTLWFTAEEWDALGDAELELRKAERFRAHVERIQNPPPEPDPEPTPSIEQTLADVATQLRMATEQLTAVAEQTGTTLPEA